MRLNGIRRSTQPCVPSKPFSDWLNQRCEEIAREAQDPDSVGQVQHLAPAARIALEIGFVEGEGQKAIDNGVRRLYRYRKAITETKRDGKYRTLPVDEFPRSIVENACHNVHPDLFYELYPELQYEREITLEPDAWCPFCQEWVTPIDGLCPWCVCEHGHLFREVGVTDDGFACLACAKKERGEQRTGSRRKSATPDVLGAVRRAA